MAVIGTTVIDFLGNVIAGDAREASPSRPARDDREAALGRCAWMEVARHAVVGYVIAALQRSPIRIRGSGREGRDREEWLWNVRPNPNQSRSEFVARMVDAMFFGPAGHALVVPAHGSLWVADGWTEEREPGRASRFENVSIEGSTEVRPTPVSADEAFVFRVPETGAWRRLAREMDATYAELGRSAVAGFIDKNASRWTVSYDQPQVGGARYEDDLRDYVNRYVRRFVTGTNVAIPLFQGMRLERVEADYSGGETTLDVVQVRKEAFETVAACMRIPASFLEGNVNNFEAVFEEVLTFCIDPVAKAIEDEIAAKSLTPEAWRSGATVRVDTTHVRHVDLFSAAGNIEKLVGSSVDTPNEIRELTGQEPVAAPGMDEYRMTRNHELYGGGDSDDEADTEGAGAASG